jgi:hypothetical protein
MDRGLTLPTQVFNFLGLLATMGDDYWVLPRREIGRHVVTGFASRTANDLRLLLFSAAGRDFASSSDRIFDATVALKGVDWPRVRVRQWRFDKVNNSYFAEARKLAQKPARVEKPRWGDARRVESLIKALKSGDPAQQTEALRRIGKMGARAAQAFAAVAGLSQSVRDAEVQQAAVAAFIALLPQRPTYAPEELRPVQERAELRETAAPALVAANDGALSLELLLAANGANFVVIEPAPAQ